MGYVMAFLFIAAAGYFMLFRRDIGAAMQAAQLAFLSIILQEISMMKTKVSESPKYQCCDEGCGVACDICKKDAGSCRCELD